jgi:hypothetical protein
MSKGEKNLPVREKRLEKSLSGHSKCAIQAPKLVSAISDSSIITLSSRNQQISKNMFTKG